MIRIDKGNGEGNREAEEEAGGEQCVGAEVVAAVSFDVVVELDDKEQVQQQDMHSQGGDGDMQREDSVFGEQGGEVGGDDGGGREGLEKTQGGVK